MSWLLHELSYPCNARSSIPMPTVLNPIVYYWYRYCLFYYYHYYKTVATDKLLRASLFPGVAELTTHHLRLINILWLPSKTFAILYTCGSSKGRASSAGGWDEDGSRRWCWPVQCYQWWRRGRHVVLSYLEFKLSFISFKFVIYNNILTKSPLSSVFPIVCSLLSSSFKLFGIQV
jgi:hypothetical protein